MIDDIFGCASTRKGVKEGNERVVVVIISASRPICLIRLINAYLPTQDTGSQAEYSECLDIIHSLFVKYQVLLPLKEILSHYDQVNK